LNLTKTDLLPKSPGPMYLPDYKVFNTGKEKSPSYQITGRPRQLGSLHGTPGPGLSIYFLMQLILGF